MSDQDSIRPNYGGRYNFAGFLYQMFGASSFAAVIHRLPPKDDSNLEVLFSVAGEGTLTTEHFGQDAVIEPAKVSMGNHERRRTFMQFKHSSAPDQNQIGPSEVIEIIAAFRASEVVANGIETLPSEYFLVTNRLFSDSARLMIQHAENDAEDNWLGSTTQKKAEREVLKQMNYVRAAGNKWRARLDQFACVYGILRDEVEKGLERLLGDLSVAVGLVGTKKLDTEWLLEMLTDHRTARPLSPATRTSDINQGLSDFYGKSQIPPVGFRRELSKDVEAVISECAIVVLNGFGGCGKSVLLRDILDRRPPSRFVVAEAARELTASLITRTVSNWRTAFPAGETSPRALNRMEIAKGDQDRPVIAVAIDGLDEAVAHLSHNWSPLRELLDLARDEFRRMGSVPTPRICVLVTCRTKDELRDCWMQFDDPDVTDYVRFISVENFSRQELHNLAATMPQGVARDRLLAAIPEGEMVELAESIRRGHRISAPAPVAPEVVEILRHPSIWGCFEALSSEQQIGILDQNIEQLSALVELYVERFIKKFKSRHVQLRSLNHRNILVHVARATASQMAGPFRRDRWLMAAVNSGECDQGEAKRIWDEAISSGLIRLEAAQDWRWTHPFVANILAQNVQSAPPSGSTQ